MRAEARPGCCPSSCHGLEQLAEGRRRQLDKLVSEGAGRLGQEVDRRATNLGGLAPGGELEERLDLLQAEAEALGSLDEPHYGRDEVRHVLGSARGGRLPRVTRIEAEEAGDRVVVTVEGPDFGPGPAGTALEAIGGPRTLALWFEDARVVRIESFATRQEAMGVT